MNTRFTIQKALQYPPIELSSIDSPSIKKESSGFPGLSWVWLALLVVAFCLAGGGHLNTARFNRLAEGQNTDREKIQHLMNCISQLEKDNWRLEERLKGLEDDQNVQRNIHGLGVLVIQDALKFGPLEDRRRRALDKIMDERMPKHFWNTKD